MLAVNDIEWDDFGGRYLVLVTDAGAIDGDDKLSSTKLGAAGAPRGRAARHRALRAAPEDAGGKEDHRSADARLQ